jgi:hypothetical protein
VTQVPLNLSSDALLIEVSSQATGDRFDSYNKLLSKQQQHLNG